MRCASAGHAVFLQDSHSPTWRYTPYLPRIQGVYIGIIAT